MTPNESDWTQRELERFHDGDLDADRAADLRAALYRDPALRRRLTDVCDVDATIRAALTDESTATIRPRLRSLRPIGVAAALVAIVATTLTFVPRGENRKTALDTTNRVAPVAPAEKTYEPVRVVLSVPVRGERRALAARSKPPVDPVPDPTPAATAPSDREMEEVLSSAPAARAFLDDLSPAEQLAVSREWAANRTQPAVAFARLRELSTRPELRRDVRIVLAELAADDRLASWLRSYRLTALMRDPETMPSKPS